MDIKVGTPVRIAGNPNACGVVRRILSGHPNQHGHATGQVAEIEWPNGNMTVWPVSELRPAE